MDKLTDDSMEIGHGKGNARSGSASHVHFPEDQFPEHDSEIVLRYSGDGHIGVHLGFLQIKHHYSIVFTIKDKLSEDLDFDPLQNLHAKITDVQPSEDGEGHVVKVEMMAHKEKLMKEKLILRDSTSNDKTLTLELQARVLGKGKGTPSLRNGIHCSGIDPDEDSEHSDWQGF